MHNPAIVLVSPLQMLLSLMQELRFEIQIGFLEFYNERRFVIIVHCRFYSNARGSIKRYVDRSVVFSVGRSVSSYLFVHFAVSRLAETC